MRQAFLHGKLQENRRDDYEHVISLSTKSALFSQKIMSVATGGFISGQQTQLADRKFMQILGNDCHNHPDKNPNGRNGFWPYPGWTSVCSASSCFLMIWHISQSSIPRSPCRVSNFLWFSKWRRKALFWSEATGAAAKQCYSVLGMIMR